MNLQWEELKQLGEATRAIHCGEGVDAETKAIRRPIVLANSFKLNDDAETLAESFAWDNTHAFNYPRSRHPNARYLEERLAGMEGGEDCVVFASGVGAIAGMFFSLLGAGDHVISSRICYTGIHGLLVEHLGKRYGVEVSLVNTNEPAEVQAALRPNTKLIHIETPANPTTCITDIAATASIAKKAGVLLSVDSTFSGLVTQRPLRLGADLVSHSLTKYINGHGDGLGGSVTGAKELITRIRDAASIHLGATINPFNAWLIMRSAVTLPLRMQRHCENGLKIARFLESHPNVKWVRYPGLESHPQYAIAKKQMTGFGGMINFALQGEAENYFRFLKGLRIITHAVCLGHAESLVQYYPQEGDRPD
ncbi:MAG: aminotransferase class I/II-fold pyridoxal phosphate-dependent enzyme, partial [Planctomycetia bacterium]|nr:aminotransferase class I/II-fold pyridoxal phosphate-dependent enzyme [Planctomycetia bacterium]